MQQKSPKLQLVYLYSHDSIKRKYYGLIQERSDIKIYNQLTSYALNGTWTL